jgi:hypothetical protein
MRRIQVIRARERMNATVTGLPALAISRSLSVLIIWGLILKGQLRRDYICISSTSRFTGYARVIYDTYYDAAAIGTCSDIFIVCKLLVGYFEAIAARSGKPSSRHIFNVYLFIVDNHVRFCPMVQFLFLVRWGER